VTDVFSTELGIRLSFVKILEFREGFEPPHTTPLGTPLVIIYYIQVISNSVKSFFIVSLGGSVSNMYGMVLARYKAIPDSKTKGLSGLPPLVVFTSEDVSSGHCLRRSACFLLLCHVLPYKFMAIF
jgi:hypothetical protein